MEFSISLELLEFNMFLITLNPLLGDSVEEYLKEIA